MKCSKCNEENKQKAEMQTTTEEVVHSKEEVSGVKGLGMRPWDLEI